MGPIYDRTKEHLGISDSGVIHMRRRVIEIAKGLRDQGITPAGVDTPGAYCVSGVGFILPKEESWIETAQELCILHPGLDMVAAQV